MDLKTMQQFALQILIEIDKLCKQYHIKYYLLGGTLLGAVRHAGFIPWDDDIDIAMPRDDYEKFKSIAAQHLPVSLGVLTHETESEYLFSFIKVINKQTSMKERQIAYLDFPYGVFVDIFPLDGSPNHWLARKAHIRRVKVYKKLIWFGYSCKKRHKILYLLGEYLRKRNYLKIWQQKLDRIVSKYQYDDSELIYNYFGAWGQKEFTTKQAIGNGKTLSFEGYDFSAFEDPHVWLNNVYEDYMTLPPVEKRKSHHDFQHLTNK